jgi:hypothetical protein
MARPITITDTIRGTTTVFYVEECDKCHETVVLPETVYSWYMRTTNVNRPISVLHAECGGPYLDGNVFVNDWWSQPMKEECESRGEVLATVTTVPHTRGLYDEDGYDDVIVTPYRSQHTTFDHAHKQLRKFIAGVSTDEKHGTVERRI